MQQEKLFRAASMRSFLNLVIIMHMSVRFAQTQTCDEGTFVYHSADVRRLKTTVCLILSPHFVSFYLCVILYISFCPLLKSSLCVFLLLYLFSLSAFTHFTLLRVASLFPGTERYHGFSG